MLDSTSYAELVTRHPFLYHTVWNADAVKLASIREHGLERVDSHYQGFWTSRPEHVYLSTKPGRYKWTDTTCPYTVIRIDTSALQPKRINPDEDHFMTHNFSGGNHINGKHVCQIFNREFPPTDYWYQWASSLGMSMPSLGAWADSIDLGTNPLETNYSISQGTLAYHGVVPPSAIQDTDLWQGH